MTSITEDVRAWARGIWPSEAGVELLIRSGHVVYDGAPWIIRRGDLASIDTAVLLEASQPWSGSERKLVRIAASLLGGPAVDLSEDISGIDRESVALVLAVIAHATGSHEDSGIEIGPDETLAFSHLPSLFPWPDDH